MYGGETKHEIFKKYLDAAETHITILKRKLHKKLETVTCLDQQKRVLLDLVRLNHNTDPVWKCVKINYNKLFKNLETFRDENLEAIKNSKTSVSFADHKTIPQALSFVENMTEFFSVEFPELWKLGQAYFQGDFGAAPDPDKVGVF